MLKRKCENEGATKRGVAQPAKKAKLQHQSESSSESPISPPLVSEGLQNSGKIISSESLIHPKILALSKAAEKKFSPGSVRVNPKLLEEKKDKKEEEETFSARFDFDGVFFTGGISFLNAAMKYTENQAVTQPQIQPCYQLLKNLEAEVKAGGDRANEADEVLSCIKFYTLTRYLIPKYECNIDQESKNHACTEAENIRAKYPTFDFPKIAKRLRDEMAKSGIRITAIIPKTWAKILPILAQRPRHLLSIASNNFLLEVVFLPLWDLAPLFAFIVAGYPRDAGGYPIPVADKTNPKGVHHEISDIIVGGKAFRYFIDDKKENSDGAKKSVECSTHFPSRSFDGDALLIDILNNTLIKESNRFMHRYLETLGHDCEDPPAELIDELYKKPSFYKKAAPPPPALLPGVDPFPVFSGPQQHSLFPGPSSSSSSASSAAEASAFLESLKNITLLNGEPSFEL